MAFVVEDGTGLATATSYISLADARAYWEDHDFDHSLYPPDEKLERALIRATQYIETFFGPYFRGCRLNYTVQRLSFPRQDFYLYGQLLSGVVPEGVAFATCEYAERILVDGSLFPDPGGLDETGALIRRKSTKVGPIEIQTSYDDGTQTLIRPYPEADILLRPFLISASGVIRN